MFAIDGDEALDLYRQQGPFDFVLTDVIHPGLNGLELAKAIRAQNHGQAIVVMTGGLVNVEHSEFANMQIPVIPKGSMDRFPEFLQWALAKNRERLS